MEAALTGLLNQTVTIAARSTSDLYGKGAFGAGSSVAARVSPATELFRTVEGKSVPVQAIVHMDGDVTVTTESQITLPDGTTPTILAVDKLTDTDGTVYATRVECG